MKPRGFFLLAIAGSLVLSAALPDRSANQSVDETLKAEFPELGERGTWTWEPEKDDTGKPTGWYDMVFTPGEGVTTGKKKKAEASDPNAPAVVFDPPAVSFFGTMYDLRMKPS